MSSKKKIASKLNIHPNKIKDNNLKYYYTNYPLRCCKYEHKQIGDINKYEYSNAILHLSNYYKDIKCDHYKNLYLEALKYDGKSLLKNEISPTQDNIMLEYVKFRKNMYTIILWPRAKNKDDEVNKLLNNNGIIYYIRKFNITYNGAINLLYQLYADQAKLSKKNFIEEKLEFMHWKKGERNTFKVIFYEHTSNFKLSGKHAPLKEEIRNLWKADKNFWGRDYVHINDYYYQTIEYCKIFLNPNSLKMLQLQDHDYFTNNKLLKCRFMVNTIKKWIVENVEPIDHERFLFFSSVVLYTYGVRTCSDVDGFVSQYPLKSKTDNFVKSVKQHFYEENTKFFFADLGITGVSNETWDNKNQIWFDKIKVMNMDELIFDPINHFYYNGLKFVILKHEIVKKYLRGNFKDYCDFLQIEILLNIKIDFPKLPDKYKNKDKFMKLVKMCMEKRYPNIENYMERFMEVIK
jgi:hypothetical protein